MHPYLTAGGKKFSKSVGSTIDPVALVAAYGDDALRWFFARDVGEVSDTDFTVARLVERANEDLAQALGNTANRILTLVHRNLEGGIDEQLAEPPAGFAGLPASVSDALAGFRLRDATRLVVDAVSNLNRDLAASEPWRLASEPARRRELEVILARQLAALRVLASAIEPIVPSFAARLRRQVGHGGGPLPPPAPTFTRIEASARSSHEPD